MGRRYDFQKLYEEYKRTNNFGPLDEGLREYLIAFLTSRFPQSKQYLKQEVISDTITICWEKMDDYDPKKSQFNTWATIIAFRLMLAYLRVQKVRRNLHSNFSDLPIFSKTGTDITPENYNGKYLDLTYDDSELPIEKTIDFEGEISKLPDETREIVWDKYIEKIPYIDMEKKYGINKNTLKTRVRKGVKQLREAYVKD
jgi:RNA polymerase sigma factor (sigma-70 family)